MSRRDRFLKACRLQPTDCTPVWFMRQAGRYMKRYREIREKHSLMQMFKNPEISAEVTLQPVRAFSVDAAIIFSDILLPLQAMGIELEFTEEMGPVIANPVRNQSDVDRLRIANPQEDLGFALKSLELVRSEIDNQVALIGFAGAPFTLAVYAIEGGASSGCLLTKELMYREPATWGLLMDKLGETVLAYLKAQIQTGVDTVQIFDSLVGYLGPSDYRSYVLVHNQKIFRELKRFGIPSIYFGTANSGLLSLVCQAGMDVVSIDWRVSLDAAWRQIGSKIGIQGNLDPVALMAPRTVLEQKAAEILNEAGGRPGHIFNLGHGILPSTPEDSVKALVDFVHEYVGRPD